MRDGENNDFIDFKRVGKFLNISVFLSKLSMLAAFLILLANTLGLDYIYAPLNNSGTTKLTSFLILFGSFLLLNKRILIHQKWIFYSSISVLVFLIYSLIDNSIINYLDSNLDEFAKTGRNTRLSLIGFYGMIAFYHFKSEIFVKIFMVLLLIFPIAGLVGYVYDAQELHGQMSFTTAILLIIACLAMIFRISAKSWIRHIVFNKDSFNTYVFYSLLVFIIPILMVPFLVKVYGVEQSIYYVLSVSILFYQALITSYAEKEAKMKFGLLKKHKQIERIAYRDFLTKAFNRHGLFDYIEQLKELDKISGDRRDYVMGLLDIDHFKKINDNYGHDKGDEVLKIISNVIRDNIRRRDFLSRWGGEEFLIILEDVELSVALNIFNEIRIAIESKDFGLDGSITCSIGVSEFTLNNDFSRKVSLTDNKLYLAKENGRNRIEY